MELDADADARHNPPAERLPAPAAAPRIGNGPYIAAIDGANAVKRALRQPGQHRRPRRRGGNA